MAESPPLASLGNGVDNSVAIDQVRELLFGETKRSTETRLDDIDYKIEVLKEEISAKFAALEARMAEQGREIDQKHINTIDAIGEAISNLGGAIRSMAAGGRNR